MFKREKKIIDTYVNIYVCVRVLSRTRVIKMCFYIIKQVIAIHVILNFLRSCFNLVIDMLLTLIENNNYRLTVRRFKN